MTENNTHSMSDVNRVVGGFTLLELMVVVVIMGMLAAYAIPSYTSLIERQRLGMVSTKLMAALQRGQSEALRRNRAVTIGNLVDGSNAWAGWTVVVDPTGTPEEIVRNEKVIPSAMKITAKDTVTQIDIGADGEVAQTYQFAISDPASGQCRRLVLYPTGSVRSVEIAFANCETWN